MNRLFLSLALNGIVFLHFIPEGLAGTSSDPSEQFLQAYLFAQQAHSLEQAQDLAAALRKYELALKLLEDISADYPDTKPDISQQNLRAKIHSLQRRLHIFEPSTKSTREVEAIAFPQ